jgi:hypothetical protein
VALGAVSLHFGARSTEGGCQQALATWGAFMCRGAQATAHESHAYGLCIRRTLRSRGEIDIDRWGFSMLCVQSIARGGARGSGEPAKLRRRVHIEFDHQLRAICLHRAQRDAKFICNLFVKLTRDNAVEYFTFTCG